MPLIRLIKMSCLAVFLLFTNNLHANTDVDVEQVPEELFPAFEHLLSYADDSSAGSPDSKQIGQVLQFVNRTKDLKQTYSMGERKGATSNYSEFHLKRSLKEVLDLVYNPQIPSHVTSPASVRRSEWVQVNGKEQDLPKLSGYLNTLSEPVVVTGVEFVENTPDVYSGAYYAYELYRALILTRHNGQRVLISISRQRDKSNVGQKGLVLGDDDNWDYLYTGEKGCTKSGLGWVKSYMYDSSSITVYYEESGPNPQVRCGIFKWIRAGWAGINMAQPHHIRKGVKRFSTNFKELIESPILADTDRLSRAFEQINNLPEEVLRRQIERYYQDLNDIYQTKSSKVKKWFDGMSGNDGHLAKMTTKEMKAVLEKAYLKQLLGKRSGIDVSLFEPLSYNPKSPG